MGTAGPSRRVFVDFFLVFWLALFFFFFFLERGAAVAGRRSDPASEVMGELIPPAVFFDLWPVF